MKEKSKVCEICEKPLDKCICCAECGHICSLEHEELYCPVCFPRKPVDSNEK